MILVPQSWTVLVYPIWTFLSDAEPIDNKMPEENKKQYNYNKWINLIQGGIGYNRSVFKQNKI